MQNANQVQTGAKKMKVNPAHNLIGKSITSSEPIVYAEWSKIFLSCGE